MVSLMNIGEKKKTQTRDIEIEIALWKARSKIILFYKKTLYILFLQM